MSDIEHWGEAVKHAFGDFHTEPDRGTPFFGRMHLKNYDGLEVAHIATNAQKIERIFSTLKADQHYFVILQQKGAMGFCSIRNEQILLRPGEIALIDSSASHRMYPQGPIQQTSVHMPKHILDQLGNNPKAIFSKLSQQHTSTKVLSTILKQLAYAPSSQHEGEGQTIQQAIHTLIQPTIHGEQTSAAPSLKTVAYQHILRLLPEADLSPERLAKEMQMSKRSLYRLFAEDDMSIARLILEARIEQCCKDLAESDLANQPLSLTEVAFRWGFSDASQFSRSFKRIKGVSPSVWRESHIASDHE